VHDRIDYIMYRPYAPNFKADSEHYKLKVMGLLKRYLIMTSHVCVCVLSTCRRCKRCVSSLK